MELSSFLIGGKNEDSGFCWLYNYSSTMANGCERNWRDNRCTMTVNERGYRDVGYNHQEKSEKAERSSRDGSSGSSSGAPSRSYLVSCEPGLQQNKCTGLFLASYEMGFDEGLGRKANTDPTSGGIDVFSGISRATIATDPELVAAHTQGFAKAHLVSGRGSKAGIYKAYETLNGLGINPLTPTQRKVIELKIYDQNEHDHKYAGRGADGPNMNKEPRGLGRDRD